MYNTLHPTQYREMYNALIHFVNSESATLILHSLESVIREDDTNTFGNVDEYFDYHCKQWCVIRDKFLNEKMLKRYPVDSLLGAAVSRYLYGSFVWSQSPQGHDYWGLIVEIIGMNHNSMVEKELAL